MWQRLVERGCFRWLNVVALVGERAGASSVVGRMRTGRNAAVQRIVLDEEMMWGRRAVSFSFSFYVGFFLQRLAERGLLFKSSIEWCRPPLTQQPSAGQ